MRIDRSAQDHEIKKVLEGQIDNLKRRRAEITSQIQQLEVEQQELNIQIDDLEQKLTQSPQPDVTSLSFPVEMEVVEPTQKFISFLNEIPSATIISKDSSLEEKFVLFTSLFAGRPDMHAKRFQSQNTGITGYSVVCANEFKKGLCTKGDKTRKRIQCINCKHQAFGGITIEELKAHIKGESPSCNDVLGAYAIDQDSMCSFIVADFDAKPKEATQEQQESLKSSAVAFLHACEKYSVPAYLERSRSGEGFHIWVFFKTLVSAKEARRLFSLLLTCAMEENAGLDFSFYDRFIPSQDTIPTAGFGNLIALPLQSKAGRSGNSIFLDGNFNPYPDQWKFLSCVKQLTINELREVLGRLSSMGELGNLADDDTEESAAKPWEKKQPELPLGKQDFMGTLEIIDANMLHLEKALLSARALNRLKRLAAFRNPEFYEAQKMRRDTWKYPRILFTADEAAEYLSLPRGIKDALFDSLRENGASFKLIDKTQKGKRIHVSFKGTLRNDQAAASQALLQHDIGVLEATTGFGKTVVGINLIAKRSRNALILVNNKNLLEQWKTALGNFLEITDEPPLRYTPTGRERRCPVIGEYSGTKKRLSGIVDIAMMQSLFQKDRVNDIVKDYGTVIIDECHHIPAFTFESVLKAINSRYVYGLTATPDRKDGHERILYAQCGPTRYKVNPLEEAKKRPFEQFVVPRFTTFLPNDPMEEFNIAKIYGDLATNPRRNELIVSDIVASVEAKRSPLVLTQRTEHVTELTALLEKRCSNVLSITGKMSDAEKKAFRNRLRNIDDDEQLVIVATGKYIGEGFDLNRLDTLFLVLPISWKGTINQYTGRLHRLYEGKTRVEVYDYIDVRIPQLERMYRKRLKGYKGVGYKIAPKGLALETDDIIYGAENFQETFLRDLGNAEKEVVVCSPHVLFHRAKAWEPVLAELRKQGVGVKIVTSEPSNSSTASQQQRDLCADFFKQLDIEYIQKSDFRQQFAIIDKRIVWYGSLNFLGKNDVDDGAIRLLDTEVAAALLESTPTL